MLLLPNASQQFRIAIDKMWKTENAPNSTNTNQTPTHNNNRMANSPLSIHTQFDREYQQLS